MNDLPTYELLRCHSCGRPRYEDEALDDKGRPIRALACPGCRSKWIAKVNPPTTYYILRFLLRYPRLIPRFIREDVLPILRGEA